MSKQIESGRDREGEDGEVHEIVGNGKIAEKTNKISYGWKRLLSILETLIYDQRKSIINTTTQLETTNDIKRLIKMFMPWIFLPSNASRKPHHSPSSAWMSISDSTHTHKSNCGNSLKTKQKCIQHIFLLLNCKLFTIRCLSVAILSSTFSSTRLMHSRNPSA